MAGDLILITGANGFIGFEALKYALVQGYRVRAAVRSEAKAELVRTNASLKALAKDDQLSFAIVPDMFAAGAFDEAVKGVSYIIHTASPIPSSEPTTDTPEESYIKPAIAGTMGILHAAEKEPSVKRVVITSSIIAIIPLAAAMMDTGVIHNAESRQPNPEGTLGAATPTFAAYGVSKVCALNQAEAWLQKTKPHFDCIHLMPTFVLGRGDLWKTLDDLQTPANKYPLTAVGVGFGDLPPTVTATCHIDDVARIHVQALDPKVPGGESFIINDVSTPRPQWNDAKAIVERRFPEAVKSGVLPLTGGVESVNGATDCEKTVRTFGIERNYEDCVVSAVEQYLELREAGK